MKRSELIQERKECLEKAKTILAKTEKEEAEDLTDEESVEVKKLTARAKEIEGEVAALDAKAREKLQLAADLEAAAGWEEKPEPRISTPTQPDPDPAAKPNAGVVTVPAREPAKVKDDPFPAFGNFLAGAVSHHRNPQAGDFLNRLSAIAPMQTAVDSEGGYLIPPTFAATILERMYEMGAVLSRVRKLPGITGNTYELPYIAETSRADGSRKGGVRGYWVAEGADLTESKPAFGKLELKLKKAGCLGYITSEQQADYGATGDLMLDLFADEMTFTVEAAVVRGTGAGQPLGLLSENCKVEVSAETNQTADTIWGPNITKMWARMWARSRANAVWLINQDAEHQLWGLALEGRFGSATTSADAIPIYHPAGTILNQGSYATLMGRPVLPVEYCSTLGNAGDIVLVDLSQYLLIDKEMQSAMSMHVQFVADVVAFRVTYRVDGRCWWKSALTPYQGTNTLSPIITLAAR
jgi:HK97 family phage major capsid protein